MPLSPISPDETLVEVNPMDAGRLWDFAAEEGNFFHTSLGEEEKLGIKVDASSFLDLPEINVESLKPDKVSLVTEMKPETDACQPEPEKEPSQILKSIA